MPPCRQAQHSNCSHGLTQLHSLPVDLYKTGPVNTQSGSGEESLLPAANYWLLIDYGKEVIIFSSITTLSLWSLMVKFSVSQITQVGVNVRNVCRDEVAPWRAKEMRAAVRARGALCTCVNLSEHISSIKGRGQSTSPVTMCPAIAF